VRCLLLFLVILLNPLTVLANDMRLGVYAITHHFAPGEYRDHHPMIQIEHRQTWIGGVFLNSASRWSWYGGYRKYLPGQQVFAELGAATGYGSMLSRSVRVGIKVNNNIDFLILPGFRDPYGWQINQPLAVAAVVIKL
jgi:hypothetical protein